MALLNSQSWLETVYEPEGRQSDMTGFRDWCHDGRINATLAGFHLPTVGLHEHCLVERPWLEVAPAEGAPAVIFNRTHRYRAHPAMWPPLISQHRHQAAFLG